MKVTKVTVYWYANGVRVVLGEHLQGSIDEGYATSRQFESLEIAAKELQPSNRAQPIIRHMLESMK